MFIGLTDAAEAKEVGTANLAAGPHTVMVEYYQFGHDSQLTVWYDKK